MAPTLSIAGYLFDIQGTKEEAIAHLRASPVAFADSLWLEVHAPLFHGNELVQLFDELRPQFEESVPFLDHSDGAQLLCCLSRCPMDIPGHRGTLSQAVFANRRRELIARGTACGNQFKRYMTWSEIDYRADRSAMMHTFNSCSKHQGPWKFELFRSKEQVLAYLHDFPLAFMDSLFLEVHGELFVMATTASSFHCSTRCAELSKRNSLLRSRKMGSSVKGRGI